MNQTEVNTQKHIYASESPALPNPRRDNCSDAAVEKILENTSQDPVGRLLEKIASLPEVRQEKVLRVRRQIAQGSYDLSDRLDATLDALLEELLF